VNAPLGNVAGNLFNDFVRQQHQAEGSGQPRFQAQLILDHAMIAARPED
jgi:hypothetical protein